MQNDKVDFIVDEDGYVNVFTDGACSSNGYKNARAGIGVWFQDNHPLYILFLNFNLITCSVYVYTELLKAARIFIL